MPKQATSDALRNHLVLNGIPLGPLSNVFVFDPVNGSDGASGESSLDPLKTLKAAFDRCVSDQHDTIVQLSGDTADNPAAAINWNKDYTHLVGLSGDLPGMGQRCRIVGTAALDLTQLVTFAGTGCIVRNIQLFNGGDADVAAGAAIVSGSRNYFKNVFFAGMGHATPAAKDDSYSLKVSGSENFFDDCTIGLDTIVRAANNAELIVSGVRNHFRNALLLSWSVTAGKFLVKLDNAGGDLRFTIFENSLFHNYTPNWATGITNAFSMPAAGDTHYLILKGINQLVGVGMGWADNVSHIYSAAPAPAAGFGISTQPTT